MSALDALVAISGASMGSPTAVAGSPSLPRELRELLAKRNGFLAFESALHVFHAGANDGSIGVEEWNARDGWRASYGDLIPAATVFFAEDIFGNQFGIEKAKVIFLEAETGRTTPFATSLEGWAKEILADFPLHTGHRLAHEWQASSGPLRPGTRLLPKTPFVCGGEYEISNLFACEAREGMSIRGEFARQTRDLPDGSKVVFRFVK